MSTISRAASRAAQGSRRAAAGWVRTAGLVLFAGQAALAQITHFNGGNLHLNLEGNLSPFGLVNSTGARGALDNISSLNGAASSVFANPAAFGTSRGISMQADFFLPGLGLGISSERTKALRQNLKGPIDAAFQDDMERAEDPLTPSYPDIGLGLYQTAGVSGFSVGVMGERLGFMAGAQRPAYGRLDLGLGGLRVGLGMSLDENDPAADTLSALLSSDVFARLEAELNNFALGIAGKPFSRLSLGLSYQRYTLNLRSEASAEIEGMMQRAGQELYFNNPNSQYRDDLNAAATGDLRGESHGLRAGASLALSRHFALDGVFSMAQKMRMEGEAEGYYHTLFALNPGGSPVFDVKKMSFTKLTQTQREKAVLRNVSFDLPWEAGVSLSGRFRLLQVNLDYSRFLRHAGLAFTVVDSLDAFDAETGEALKARSGGDSVETSSFSKRYSLRLSQQVAVGLRLHQVFLHAGALFYEVKEDDLLEEVAAYRPSFLPFIPTLNLGYDFPLGPRFKTTVSLLAFPVSLFKTSVEYRY